MGHTFAPKALRKELDATLKVLEKGKNPPCKEIINREMKVFWEVVMPRISSPANVCGKSWEKGQFAYKCRTCEKDPTCVLCIDCFQIDKHVGHDYKIVRTYGGMCDCGDADSWDPNGFCTAHPGNAAAPDRLRELPARMREWLTEIIGFCISALQKGTLAMQWSIEFKQLLNTMKFLAKGLMMIINTGDVGRHIVARTFCDGKDEILVYLFDHELTGLFEKPWEGSYAMLYDLIQALMPESYFKLAFGRVLVGNYIDLCDFGAFKPLSDREKSLRDLSVQVFTVSNVCRRLLDPKKLHDDNMNILHYMLMGGFHYFCALKKLATDDIRTAERRSICMRVASYVEVFFNDLTYVLNSDVQMIESFLCDDSLVKLFCSLLYTVQQLSVISENALEKSNVADNVTCLDGALQNVFKCIVGSVLPLQSRGFEWKSGTQMPDHCRVSDDKFLGGTVDQFIDDILRKKSPIIQGSENEEKREQCIADMLQPAEGQKLHGFQLLIGWIFGFLQVTASQIEQKGESAGTEYAFALPLHRLFAQLASAIVSVNALEDVTVLIPANFTTEQLALCMVQPMQLQKVRAKLINGPTADVPNEIRAKCDYYEASAQLDQDICFLQIAACRIGPSVFYKSVGDVFALKNQDILSMTLIFHMVVTIATRTEKSPRELYEQSAINILAFGQQTHSDFLKNYAIRYSLFVEDNDVDNHNGVDRDEVFSTLTDRVNTTNPAVYALKKEFYDKVTLYDANVTFSDVTQVLQAKSQHSAPLTLLPKMPTGGPFLRSVLLLHTYFPDRMLQYYFDIMQKGVMRADYLLRFLLDVIICALQTIKQRDLVVEQYGSTHVQTHLRDSDYRSNCVREEVEITNIILCLQDPVDFLEAKEAGAEPQGLNIIQIVQDMRKRAELVDLHDKMDAVLRLAQQHIWGVAIMENESMESAGVHKETREAKMLKRQAKALERFKKQQKVFETNENLDIHESAVEDKISDGSSKKASSLASEMDTFYSQMVCVSCHERSHDAGGLGLIVHAIHSNALKVIHRDKYPKDTEQWFNRFPEELQSVLCPEGGTMHITTCGHAIHEDCLQNLMNHNRSNTSVFNGHKGSDLLLSHEFLCPTCSRLSSGILNTHSTGEPAQSYVGSNSLHESASYSTANLSEGVQPLQLPAIEVSRSQSALFWVHTRKIAVADFEEEDLDVLSGNQFETAFRVFGMQIALLEIQARHHVGLITMRKLMLLHVFLQNIVNSLRSYSEGSEEGKVIQSVQRDLIELLRGNKIGQGLEIADFDPFTLFLNLVVRVVLSGDSRDSVYRYVRETIFNLALQQSTEADGTLVLVRQMTIFHMILCPGDIFLPNSFQESMEKLFAKIPDALIPKAENHSAIEFPGGAHAHALPLMSDPIVLQGLDKAPENFLDYVVSTHSETCARCSTKAWHRMACLNCGSIVCFISKCCPKECTQHAFECGGGSCLFVSISASASEVLFVNAHTNQCALLKSPWLDAHGEQDIGCHRGRPLWKDAETVQMLNKYWLEGSFFQDTGTIVEKAWLFTSDEL